MAYTDEDGHEFCDGEIESPVKLEHAEVNEEVENFYRNEERQAKYVFDARHGL